MLPRTALNSLSLALIAAGIFMACTPASRTAPINKTLRNNNTELGSDKEFNKIAGKPGACVSLADLSKFLLAKKNATLFVTDLQLLGKTLAIPGLDNPALEDSYAQAKYLLEKSKPHLVYPDISYIRDLLTVEKQEACTSVSFKDSAGKITNFSVLAEGSSNTGGKAGKLGSRKIILTNLRTKEVRVYSLGIDQVKIRVYSLIDGDNIQLCPPKPSENRFLREGYTIDFGGKAKKIGLNKSFAQLLADYLLQVPDSLFFQLASAQADNVQVTEADMNAFSKQIQSRQLQEIKCKTQ